jgi:glycerophosphoryl diester phosphodiesterase
MIVIAHRGFSSRYPENTLPAIRAAMRLGVDMVEIDVQQTRDGELIVFHDYRLDRVCGVRARVRDKTLRQIKRLHPAVPTLAEVLRLRYPLLIEIKGADPEKVAALVGNRQDVIIFSIHAGKMQRLAKANPRIRRFGLAARKLRLKTPVEGVGLSRRLVDSPAVVRRIHRRGWKLFVWTVNDPREMRRLRDWGVDGLITNHPERALQL